MSPDCVHTQKAVPSTSVTDPSMAELGLCCPSHPSTCPSRTVVGLWHDKDRAGRLAQHVLAHGAEQHRGATAAGQHEELGVDLLRGLDELSPGQPENGAQLHL